MTTVVDRTLLSALPDILEVPEFTAADQECLDEIRAVLERRNALSRFGVTLLHQHFDMTDDEILVETIDVENRILTSRPEKLAGLTGSGIETSWRLDHPASMQVCETLCQPDRDAQGNPIHMRPHYRTD
jgi:Glu-tRNA(Gln) amidotransferase subunit E-like FAD-binding protein